MADDLTDTPEETLAAAVDDLFTDLESANESTSLGANEGDYREVAAMVDVPRCGEGPYLLDLLGAVRANHGRRSVSLTGRERHAVARLRHDAEQNVYRRRAIICHDRHAYATSGIVMFALYWAERWLDATRSATDAELLPVLRERDRDARGERAKRRRQLRRWECGWAPPHDKATIARTAAKLGGARKAAAFYYGVMFQNRPLIPLYLPCERTARRVTSRGASRARRSRRRSRRAASRSPGGGSDPGGGEPPGHRPDPDDVVLRPQLGPVGGRR